MQLVYSSAILIFFAAALKNTEIYKEWREFKQNYNKSYTSIYEECIRYIKFEENLQIILEHNELYKNGEVSYDMGLNTYSDMGTEEMETTLMGFKMDEKDRENFFNAELFAPTSLSLQAIPTSMDWSTKGAVTPVKYQGKCGSCWAFSTTGALEAQHFLKTNQLISLSEQNLVDCDTNNNGCSGGWMGTAFDYIRDNGGINTRSSYPYTAKEETCKFKRKNIGASCSGYTRIAGNENALLQAVVKKGPIAVAIHASKSFEKYSKGVFDDRSCGNKVPNHAVLIVGYGTEFGRDYWLVKNSYGIGWGEKGYIKMSRNKNNQCSIASWALFPNV